MALNSDSPRVGTSGNLASGGSYDLLLIKYLDGFPEGRLSFGLYDTPMKITGLQKVAQVFLKTLMSTKGSDPFYPSRGTTFPGLLQSANVVTSDATLTAEIQTAVEAAAEQTVSSTSASNTDPSSQLESVQILGLEVSEDMVVLYMKMRTVAGEDAALSLPFPTFGIE
jgi:hypothetical protein